MSSAETPTIRDADGAVSHLAEISPQLRGCAILSERGGVLASSGDPEAWGAAAAELIAAADAAGPEPASHAHVATADGEAFFVREGDLVAVAVSDRFVLASLMLFDLRATLRELAGAD
ncbi:MAG: hypothetical protein ACRDL6_10855 [Solirubrobacterales bacterium]